MDEQLGQLQVVLGVDEAVPGAGLPEERTVGAVLGEELVAVDIGRMIGTSETGYLRVDVHVHEIEALSDGVEMGRGPVTFAPDAEDFVESVMRELTRSLGVDGPEPEAASS